MEDFKFIENLEEPKNTILIESGLAKLNINAPDFVVNKIITAPDFLYRTPSGKFTENLNSHEWEIPTLDISAKEDKYKQE
jgi:hypothetical protein